MSAEDLSVPQSTLRHRLEDIPESVRPHIKMGYSLLSRSGEAKQREIVEYVIDNFARRGKYDLEQVASISGIDRNVVGDVLSAIAVTVGAVFDIDVSEEDFFRFSDKILDAQHGEVAKRILARTFEHKAELKKKVDESKVANSVLPSFSSASCEIDQRLIFDNEDNVTGNVALAVIHIGTDTQDDYWFQIASSDLEILVDKLSTLSRRLKIVDAN